MKMPIILDCILREDGYHTAEPPFYAANIYLVAIQAAGVDTIGFGLRLNQQKF
jgi:hypothetical protein